MICPISQTPDVSLRRSSEPENVLGGTFSVAYGMRSYNPELGRWVNRDPIGEYGGLNLLAFGNNSAVNNFDYLGQSSEECEEICGGPVVNCFRTSTSLVFCDFGGGVGRSKEASEDEYPDIPWADGGAEPFPPGTSGPTDRLFPISPAPAIPGYPSPSDPTCDILGDTQNEHWEYGAPCMLWYPSEGVMTTHTFEKCEKKYWWLPFSPKIWRNHEETECVKKWCGGVVVI